MRNLPSQCILTSNSAPKKNVPLHSKQVTSNRRKCKEPIRSADTFTACRNQEQKSLSFPDYKLQLIKNQEMHHPLIHNKESHNLGLEEGETYDVTVPVVSNLVFLDLDNTLIPTAWMMEQWRLSDRHPAYTTDAINKRLTESGLFNALDKFFGSVIALGGNQRIVIVTNAAIKTVQSFYLTYCLPELGDLLDKYNIPIRSTERWLDDCGPIPPPHHDRAFREFYTTVKFLQFEKELRSFSKYLTDIRSVTIDNNINKDNNCKINKPIKNQQHPLEYKPMIDVISVGDQLCEITAAIRLGAFNSPMIRYTKLLMILDLIGDRFITTTPEIFVMRLEDTLSTLLHILSTQTATVVNRSLWPTSSTDTLMGQYNTMKTMDWALKGNSQYYLMNKEHSFNSKHWGLSTLLDKTCKKQSARWSKMAVWVARSFSLAYCIGEPQHFNIEDCCPLVGLTITNSNDEENCFLNENSSSSNPLFFTNRYENGVLTETDSDDKLALKWKTFPVSRHPTNELLPNFDSWSGTETVSTTDETSTSHV